MFRFVDLPWKRRRIEGAESLITPLPAQYLHALLAYRKSVLLRITGRVEESEAVLDKFSAFTLSLESDPAHGRCPRYNAHLGDIVISISENLTVKWNLEESK